MKSVTYDDGRGEVLGVVLEEDDRFMVVQFEDRAAPNTICKTDRKWMDYIKREE